MNLQHIGMSDNVIDMRVSFTPDMDAMFGPAVEAQPFISSVSPEVVLTSGLAMLGTIAAGLVWLGWNIWRSMS